MTYLEKELKNAIAEIEQTIKDKKEKFIRIDIEIVTYSADFEVLKNACKLDFESLKTIFIALSSGEKIERISAKAIFDRYGYDFDKILCSCDCHWIKIFKNIECDEKDINETCYTALAKKWIEKAKKGVDYKTKSNNVFNFSHVLRRFPECWNEYNVFMCYHWQTIPTVKELALALKHTLDRCNNQEPGYLAFSYGPIDKTKYHENIIFGLYQMEKYQTI